MSGQWTQNFSFVTGVVRLADLTYVAVVGDDLAEENMEHSLFAFWDAGAWGGKGIQTEWQTVAGTIIKHPKEQAIFLGLGGELQCIGSGDVHNELINPSGEPGPRKRGAMRGIGSIEGKAYAVGMDRQVYRRDGVDSWTCIDHSARPKAGDDAIVSFEAIDGYSAKEIYAVGREGEIWQYDGVSWRQITSPTNIILTKICCAPDGNVYICGLAGILLRGRHDNWEIIEQEDTEADLWGIAWHADALYLASMNFVYKLDGDKLALVDFGADTPGTCFHLSAADGVLWSIGAKDLMAFDGAQWVRID
jgi:hypothetical protein